MASWPTVFMEPKKGLVNRLPMAGTKVRKWTMREVLSASLLLTVINLGGSRAITCFCLGHCPGNELNGTCTAPPGAPCFSGNSSLFLFFMYCLSSLDDSSYVHQRKNMTWVLFVKIRSLNIAILYRFLIFPYDMGTFCFLSLNLAILYLFLICSC